MKRILLIALIICIHPTEKVQALPPSLSCPQMEQGPPCQEFWRAEAVFIGTATEVVTVPWTGTGVAYWQQHQKLTARLTVEETFRGNVEAEITFEMNDCYYPFKQGEKYLVYAHKGRDGKLSQRLGYSRTRLLSEAGDDLGYIRSIHGAAEGSRIYGTAINHSGLFRLRTSTSEPTTLSDPIPGLKVVAEGAGQSYETTTDGAGNFEFAGLPGGIYRVRASVPSYLSGGEWKVEVTNRGCAPLRFSIQATGVIGGRVLDANGQPVTNVPVSVFSAEGVTDRMLESVRSGYVPTAYTDRRGHFSFERLPSGRYFIAVNLVRGDGAAGGAVSAYPRTFYPGVISLLEATVITLSDGQEKRDIDVRFLNP